MTTTEAIARTDEPRLTSLSHGGGCGCKIAPGVLSEILRGSGQAAMPVPEALLVGIETADDAAVWKLNDTQALVATTDFFMPIVDDPADFGRIAATNALSDVYAMGGQPIMALAIVGMPIGRLSHATIGAILEGGAAACRDAGIPVAGGHTIDSVEAIYGLVALGLVHPDRVRRNAAARAGDVLVLGKPLGVGVMSAALKKGALDAAGYAAMIATTTRLNTAGPDLAALDGVHAMTDVTGFALAGHALEMARGSRCDVRLDWTAVPLLDGVRSLAARGFVTGASGRNWASYGAEVALPAGFPAEDQALLTDPQTSGGLLVACDPAAVAAVIDTFHRHGFDARRRHRRDRGDRGRPPPRRKPLADRPHRRLAMSSAPAAASARARSRASRRSRQRRHSTQPSRPTATRTRRILPSGPSTSAIRCQFECRSMPAASSSPIQITDPMAESRRKVPNGIVESPAGTEISVRTPGREAADQHRLAAVAVEPVDRRLDVLGLDRRPLPEAGDQRHEALPPEHPRDHEPRQVADQRAGERGEGHEPEVQRPGPDCEPGHRHDHLGRDRREQVLGQHQEEDADVAERRDDLDDPLFHGLLVYSGKGHWGGIGQERSPSSQESRRRKSATRALVRSVRHWPRIIG